MAALVLGRSSDQAPLGEEVSRSSWALVALIALPARLPAQGDSDAAKPPNFGGPDSVETQLEDDAEPSEPLGRLEFLDRWFDYKKDLKERTGFSFGFDYTGAYLSSDESLGRDEAGSGIARFMGSWELTGRGSANSGALVWKVEDRHRYTAGTPNSFSLEIGNVGTFQAPFSNQGTRLTNFYWRQRLAGGRVSIYGGLLDIRDYVDISPLGSPFTQFMNFAFGTGGLTLEIPNDAFLGVAAGAMLTDQVYLIAGLGDANSDPTDPLETFDTFFDDAEYFKSVEVGFTTSRDRIFKDNVHLTLWHMDRRVRRGLPEGWGLNLGYTRPVKERWTPFVKVGWADDGGARLETSLSAGVGYETVPGRDLLAFGVNWGDPNDATYDPGLDEQLGLEVFYRISLADQIVLTPDIQLLLDPALNPTEDSIWVFGIRLRMAQ